MRKRLCLIAVLILLAGLSGAGFISMTAEDTLPNSMISEFENSKVYRHELEAVGGKAAILADEFSRWFEGLWRGKALARTVGCLAVAVSGLIFYVARHLPGEGGDDDRHGSDRRTD